MTAVIRATAFGGPDVLAVREETVPDPGPGEVSIRVRAAGVNPIDHKLYSGAFGTDESTLPRPVGMELAGVVTAVGAEAVGPGGPLRVGDEVIAHGRPGAHAEQVTWPAEIVVPKPAELGWEPAGGLLLVGSTAVHLLTATGIGAGDTVLVHGVAGSVGLTAAQLAILRGARVVGTAAEHRHEWLASYGIEPVTYGPGLAERVRSLLGDGAAPDGVDAALDCVGTDEAVEVSLELVADRARIATIVAFDRAQADGFAALGGGPGADPGTEVRANAWREVVPLAAQGRLDIVIARTFPLAEAAAAHRYVADGHAGGKVILLAGG